MLKALKQQCFEGEDNLFFSLTPSMHDFCFLFFFLQLFLELLWTTISLFHISING
jgi:hypothetical protein